MGGPSMALTDRANNSELASPSLDNPSSDRIMLNGDLSVICREKEQEMDDGIGNSPQAPEPPSRWKLYIKSMLNSIWTNAFLALLSVYALFSDDIRALAFGKGADNTFYALTTGTFAVFLCIVLLESLVRRHYFLGLFFWLDIISTLSLTGDIGWIIPEGISYAEQVTDVFKAARSSRIARVVSLMRMLRITRATKLYTEAKKLQRKRLEENGSRMNHSHTEYESAEKAIPLRRSSILTFKENKKFKDDVEQLVEAPPKESKISRLLTENTITHVVAMIMLIMFCLPLFSQDYYYSPPTSYDYGASILSQGQSMVSGEDFAVMCRSFIDLQNNDNYPLVQLTGPNCSMSSGDISPDELRCTEQSVVAVGNYTIIVDIRYSTHLTSILNVCKTILLCVMLAIGAIVFSYDTNELVVVPFESMLEKVKLLSKSPADFWNADNEDEIGVFTLQYNMQGPHGTLDKHGTNYETYILEGVIMKIARLLAVEFGEAGCRVIEGNLAAHDFLDPLIPGTKVYGVFGFIQILHFEQLTELMQTQVIKFVNQIAEVVHSTVDKCAGSTNKNIGDSFFVRWGFNMQDILPTPEDFLLRTRSAEVLCDLSLYACLKIIAKVTKLKHVQRQDLKLALGLHSGWAIEGPIGSFHKIDVSYLSPNVNIAARLEAATKQYGVPLLLSELMVNKFTRYGRALCREIDTVTVKGSNVPMRIYTVDVDASLLESKHCKYEALDHIERKIKRAGKKKLFLAELKQDKKASSRLFLEDRDILTMRSRITPEFVAYFKEGYSNYVSGDWNQAVECFRKALLLRPKDGPTLTLMAYMESKKFRPPIPWYGYRELKEK